ncbi:translation initiation factor IF-2-like [Cervus canadensis]|uniref:translation initiation factor IF-2-like n=1 Tax=Cervus canadensis TaxID=1574408 RepID=UPI001C9E60AC|nr:translation initiation factor IF-2-like [Cervus canadensis]
MKVRGLRFGSSRGSHLPCPAPPCAPEPPPQPKRTAKATCRDTPNSNDPCERKAGSRATGRERSRRPGLRDRTPPPQALARPSPSAAPRSCPGRTASVKSGRLDEESPEPVGAGQELAGAIGSRRGRAARRRHLLSAPRPLEAGKPSPPGRARPPTPPRPCEPGRDLGLGALRVGGRGSAWPPFASPASPSRETCPQSGDSQVDLLRAQPTPNAPKPQAGLGDWAPQAPGLAWGDAAGRRPQPLIAGAWASPPPPSLCPFKLPPPPAPPPLPPLCHRPRVTRWPGRAATQAQTRAAPPRRPGQHPCSLRLRAGSARRGGCGAHRGSAGRAACPPTPSARPGPGSGWTGKSTFLTRKVSTRFCSSALWRRFFNSCRKIKKTHRQISKNTQLIYKQGGNRTLRNSAAPKTAVDGKQFGKRPPRLSESACLVRPPTQKPTADSVRGEHVSFRAREGPIEPRRAPRPGSFAMPRDLKMEHVGEASGHHKAPGITEEPVQEVPPRSLGFCSGRSQLPCCEDTQGTLVW